MHHTTFSLSSIAITILCTLTTSSLAEQSFVYKQVGIDGISRSVDPPSRVNPADVSVNYDNFLPTVFGGTTVLRGSRQVGFDEVGDDLNLVGSIGRLDTMGFAVSNRSLTNGFGMGHFTIRARNRDTGLLIGQTSFSFDMDMGVNEGAFFELPPGLFTQTNIILSPQIWLTFQWNSIQFAESAAVVHTPFGSPQAIGSSTSLIRNFTTGLDADLGGGGLPNSFMWFVTTSPVPAPGAAGLLVVLGLGAARRKR